MYMGKDLAEDKLYELIYRFNERTINCIDFHIALFMKMAELVRYYLLGVGTLARRVQGSQFIMP